MTKLWPLFTLAICLTAAAVRGELHGANALLSGELELDQLLAEVETNHARTAQLEQEQLQLHAREQTLHAELKQRVNALYRITRNGMTPVTGGFEAVRSHVARVRRLRALLQRDVQAWSELQQHSRSTRSEAELTRATLLHARERLTALQTQAALAVAPLPELTPPPQPSQHAAYGLRIANEPARTLWATQRGKLPAPVSGEVRLSDSNRGPNEGPALLFEAPAATSVRAVASGRVAFSAVAAGHGRTVILDHGEGYTTVYSQLGSLEVRVGDEVSALARIGDIAADAQPPGLLFQVRHGTRTLAPRSWLGL